VKAVTSEQMRRLDQASIEKYSIPSILLMENAGRAVASAVIREYGNCPVLVFAGKGNNGGDGLVVARDLVNHGSPVRVVLLEDPEQLKPDPLLNFRIARKMKIPMTLARPKMTERVFEACSRKAAVIVDAIFGIGLNSPVRGVFASAIRAIRRSGRPVVSIDIPSGLDADTGEIHGDAVTAERTVTLGLPKRGLTRQEGPAHAGKIEVADIGIPRPLLVPFLR